ncbi:hypothetical protein F4561_005184 [Lipingzhangella halophila]|uniref:HEAT repeat domain-containing protein n=1 Tax=Lipingzhangella halophila TaxID=1783352 RepID=A0A7W7W5Z1_9ACTN|nr:hypothetical protein [Lipingzhangella halophila]MBB4934364.1 hypothetical protein [Lipingzhangella halophila]
MPEPAVSDLAVVDDPRDARGIRHDIVWLLAHRFDELPGFVQNCLRGIASDLRAAPAFNGTSDTECLRFALEVASGQLDGAQIVARFQTLRQQGHGTELCHAFALWDSDQAVTYLSVLCTDTSTALRATSAYALVRLLARDPAREPVIAAALSTATSHEPGCLLPLRLGDALAEHPEVELSAVRHRLATHPSAKVRAAGAKQHNASD